MTSANQTAILLCLATADDVNPTTADLPYAGKQARFMLPVVDRPLLQHSIEVLARARYQQIHVVMNTAPEAIRDLLVDGVRWGCRIHYHLLSARADLFAFLRALDIDSQAPVLLANANEVIDLSTCDLVDAPCVIRGAQGAASPYDMPWMWVIPALITLRSEDVLNGHWQELTRTWSSSQSTSPALQSANALQLLSAQEAVLLNQFPALIGASQVEPGIWLARNVVLHPSVKIAAPIFIGEDCRLDAGCSIGPNVAIEHTSRIGQHTEISHSHVVSGTWLGEHLNMQYMLIQPGNIWNAMLSVQIPLHDDAMLGTIQPKRRLGAWLLHIFASGFARLSALLIYLACLPLLLVMKATMRDRHDVEAVVLPHAQDSPPTKHLFVMTYPTRSAMHSSGFSHFLHWFLPGLWYVFTAKLHWVGLAAKTVDEYQAMDEDWRSAYQQSKLGLIQAAWLDFGKEAAEWEARIAEMVYANQHMSIRHDLGLLLRYPLSLFMPAELKSAVNDTATGASL